MNLGYLWKALYNERVIKALDECRLSIVNQMPCAKRRRDMRKVEVQEQHVVEQHHNNVNPNRNVNIQSDNGVGIYNNGRPVMINQQQQRLGGDNSSDYLDRHVRY